MNKFRHILVVIDELNFSLQAAQRALELSRKTGGKIAIALLNHPYSLHQLADLVKRYQHPEQITTYKQKLDQLALFNERLKDVLNVNEVEFHIVNSASQVLPLAERLAVDAIAIAADKHDWWHLIDHQPVDVYLMRRSPLPVFVVKGHQWRTTGQILSAVQAFSDDDIHIQLSEVIIEESNHLSELLHKECNIVDCCCDDSVSMSFQDDFNPAQEDERHLSQIENLCDKYHLAHKHIYLKHTLPEMAIESLSRNTKTDLLIVGHSGKHFIKNRLAGHTAEEVMDNIDCDLLVMKPQRIEPNLMNVVV